MKNNVIYLEILEKLKDTQECDIKVVSGNRAFSHMASLQNHKFGYYFWLFAHLPRPKNK